MKIKRNCTVQALRGKYLVIIYSADRAPQGIEVNESFAMLLKKAIALGEFSEEDIASLMVELYDLDADTAKEEATKTIALWLENGICE